MRQPMGALALVMVLLLGMGVGMAGSQELAQGTAATGISPVVTQETEGPVRLAQAAKGGSETSFSDVAAIIEKFHCTVCHAGPSPRDGLRLDSYENVMKGGKHGPVVLPGSPQKSKLLLQVNGAKEPRMPMGGPPWLSDDEVKAIETWISSGAKGPKS